MGAVFLLALLTLAGARPAPAIVRGLRAVRVGDARDRAAAVLSVAIRGLPPERADWGRAMLGELDAVCGSRARWRFSLGCVNAALALRIRARFGGSHRDGAVVRSMVLAAVAAALVLGAYGLVRYPLPGAWAGTLAFLAVLLGYGVGALGLSRGMTPGAVVARRYGLLGGVVTGATWLVAIFPTAPLKEWVLAPLAIAIVSPGCVAVLAGRATRDTRAATAGSVWCGLVGGIVVFVIWVTATYLRDGGPFDPQLIRDFHASGAPDLTAYAVGDSLGAALAMLVMIPTVAFAAGTLAARIGTAPTRPSSVSRRRRATAR
jgi:hypothetical protein